MSLSDYPRHYRVVKPINAWVRVGSARPTRFAGRATSLDPVYAATVLAVGDRLIELWRISLVVLGGGERWRIRFETPDDEEGRVSGDIGGDRAIPDPVRREFIKPIFGDEYADGQYPAGNEQDRPAVQASRVVRLDPGAEGNRARMFRNPVMAAHHVAGTILGARLAVQHGSRRARPRHVEVHALAAHSVKWPPLMAHEH